MNHLRENFGSSKTLRPRGVRNAVQVGRDRWNRSGFSSADGNDGDDELCLEYKKNTDMTSSSFALFLFAFSSSTSSSANPSLTSASPKSMRTPTPVSREYLQVSPRKIRYKKLRGLISR